MLEFSASVEEKFELADLPIAWWSVIRRLLCVF